MANPPMLIPENFLFFSKILKLIRKLCLIMVKKIEFDLKYLKAKGRR